MSLNLNTLAEEFCDNATKHGFWETPNRGERIALMHSELSEALEYIRKPGADDKLPQFSGEVVELADATIRILDYCAFYNLPIHEAVMAKHEYNIKRPYKHGKQF